MNPEFMLTVSSFFTGLPRHFLLGFLFFLQGNVGRSITTNQTQIDLYARAGTRAPKDNPQASLGSLTL